MVVLLAVEVVVAVFSGSVVVLDAETVFAFTEMVEEAISAFLGSSFST